MVPFLTAYFLSEGESQMKTSESSVSCSCLASFVSILISNVVSPLTLSPPTARTLKPSFFPHSQALHIYALVPGLHFQGHTGHLLEPLLPLRLQGENGLSCVSPEVKCRKKPQLYSSKLRTASLQHSFDSSPYSILYLKY